MSMLPGILKQAINRFNKSKTGPLGYFDESLGSLVIGIGGCGCDIANKMITNKHSKMTYLAVDSDVATLKKCKSKRKILLLNNSISGKIDAELEYKLASIPCTDIVFIVSGMGGVTGTQTSPVIAEWAKKHGALPIGVAVLPFAKEGKQRNSVARKGVMSLRQATQSLIVVSLQRLRFRSSFSSSDDDLYQKADKIISTAISGVTDTFFQDETKDFISTDIKSMLSSGGIAWVGCGRASGKDRAWQATVKAVNSPTLGASKLQNALQALIFIVADNGLNSREVSNVIDTVIECANKTLQTLHRVSTSVKNKDVLVIIIAGKGILSSQYKSPQLDNGLLVDEYEFEIPAFIRSQPQFDELIFEDESITHLRYKNINDC